MGSWFKYVTRKRGTSPIHVDSQKVQAHELDVKKIHRAIEKLPDGYRVVFSLYLLEGYDHGEISQIMGISESTSKTQLHRAKTKLKELLTV